MSEEIDKVLTLLQDGEWHPLTELTKKARLNPAEIRLITDFLIKYDLIELRKAEQEAKLTRLTCDFIRQIEDLR